MAWYSVNGECSEMPEGQQHGDMDAEFRPEDQDMFDLMLNGANVEATHAPFQPDDTIVRPASFDSSCSSSCIAFNNLTMNNGSLVLPAWSCPAVLAPAVAAATSSAPAQLTTMPAAAAAAPSLQGMVPWSRPAIALYEQDTSPWPRPSAAASHHQHLDHQPPDQMMHIATLPQLQQQQPNALSMSSCCSAEAPAASLGLSLPLLEMSDPTGALDHMHNPRGMQLDASHLFTTSLSALPHTLSHSEVADLYRTSLPPSVSSITCWPSSFSVSSSSQSASAATDPSKPWKWDGGPAPTTSCPNLMMGFKEFVATRDIRMSGSGNAGGGGYPASNFFAHQRDASSSAFRAPANQGRKRSSDFLSESSAGQAGHQALHAGHQASSSLHAADMASVGAVAMVLPHNSVQPTPAANMVPIVGPSSSTLAGHLFSAAGPGGTSVSCSKTSAEAFNPASAHQATGFLFANRERTVPPPAAPTPGWLFGELSLLQRQSARPVAFASSLDLTAGASVAASAGRTAATTESSEQPVANHGQLGVVASSVGPQPAGHLIPPSTQAAHRFPSVPAGQASPRLASAAGGGGRRQSFERVVPMAVGRLSLDQLVAEPAGRMQEWRAPAAGEPPPAAATQPPAGAGQMPSVLAPAGSPGVVAGPAWMTFFSQCSASLTAAAAALQLAGDDPQMLMTRSPTSCAAKNDLAALDLTLPSWCDDGAELGVDVQQPSGATAAAAAAAAAAPATVNVASAMPAAAGGGGGGDGAVSVGLSVPTGRDSESALSGFGRTTAARREAQLPSLEAVRQVFKLPLKDAATRLGVSVSHMKNICRRLGVRAWPHRKLSSLQGLRAAVLESDDRPDDEKTEVIGQIERTRVAVIADPEFAIPADLDMKRKAVYKQRHAICKQQQMEQDMSEGAP